MAQTEAALKIQANYRGVKTRKQVKEEFGFESKTINDQSKANESGQDDQNVQEARRLVLQIQKSLEPFSYDPAPADDK